MKNTIEASRNILILTDDRNQFYSSSKEYGGSMNTSIILKELENFGYKVTIKGFSEIFSNDDSYKNYFVLYQSTEDPDLRYKDYVEDVILGLKISGAYLIPSFEYFRAHHNKVFMEIYRLRANYDKSIMSWHFGTFEELTKTKCNFTYPVVIKPSAGSKSKDISLAQNKKELLAAAFKISRSFTLVNTLRAVKAFLHFKNYNPISNNRKKFIVQEFVSGLSGDYKVLIYGDKYYVVRRENRPGDFRASGSGLFTFLDVALDDLLNYAESVFTKSDTPFLGIDIGIRDGRFFLLEFQFMVMGSGALERSSAYFRKIDNKWQVIREKSILEKVFAESVYLYINNLNKK